MKKITLYGKQCENIKFNEKSQKDMSTVFARGSQLRGDKNGKVSKSLQSKFLKSKSLL